MSHCESKIQLSGPIPKLHSEAITAVNWDCLSVFDGHIHTFYFGATGTPVLGFKAIVGSALFVLHRECNVDSLRSTSGANLLTVGLWDDGPMVARSNLSQVPPLHMHVGKWPAARRPPRGRQV